MNKQKHKKQLIENIKAYFGYSNYKNKLKRLNDLNYRKVKRMAKILGVYEKYYDDTLSDGDYCSWYRL